MKFFRLLDKDTKLIVPIVLISFYFTLSSCTTFGSKGLGHGFSQFGIYCIRGAVKFTPTPASLAGGPSNGPALPFDSSDCQNLAEGFGSSWEFSRIDDAETKLTGTKWDLYQVRQFIDGNTYCLLKVFVPSNVVLDKGLGNWQAKLQLGNWNVTCPVQEINICAEDVHEGQFVHVFNTTQHIDGCELGSQGINDPGFIPYPQ